ncbi:TetR/AcrR family transcriptional regulator [Bosea sp. (in: a-proteobacteria)]|uniref:TetR/AcrR family transcriptional regulator n=1 Tax=Bosea sp. (in: a-proteobacteria) TaxID=1871050 RepID=UPI003B3B57DE
MSAADTRQQIVEAADKLFYEQGFETTAFADIAAATRLSRGNFYYHFKTKDEILAAVVALRLDRTRQMLDHWRERACGPRDALRSFAQMLIANREAIMRHGCPVGTLCAELAKLDHGGLAQATDVFVLFRRWLAEQFVALGRAPDAHDLALHLLMRSQGIAALANAFGDETFIRREVAAIEQWLDSECPVIAADPAE